MMLVMQSVVYRLYDLDGVLLYVGVTSQLQRRLMTHKNKFEWWNEVVRVGLDHFQDRNNALAFESKIIKEEKPKYNVKQTDKEPKYWLVKGYKRPPVWPPKRKGKRSK